MIAGEILNITLDIALVTIQIHFFSLIYINGTGIEDYWTYHSQSVGRAGTISINDHNGNLTLIHNDINIYSGACPINLYHVFNTNDKETDIGYGNGWRLNYAQTLSYEEIDDDIVYFKHIDGDGTAHYYYCKEIMMIPYCALMRWIKIQR